jgi:hypothetical protein
MEALACLCNLSLCGCIGDNPLAFLDACNVKNLVSYLCSADSTFRLFGAVTLGNIASTIALQDSVVDGGALAPLVTISNQADLETQRCIAYVSILFYILVFFFLIEKLRHYATLQLILNDEWILLGKGDCQL